MTGDEVTTAGKVTAGGMVTTGDKLTTGDKGTVSGKVTSHKHLVRNLTTRRQDTSGQTPKR